MWTRPKEGHDTVPLSSRLLGIKRLVRAVWVIGLATAPVAALSLPAQASDVSQHEWWLGKLHVTDAWRTTTGKGVTVAVLADGVAPGQADITGSVIAGPDFTKSGRHPGGPYFGTIGTGLASLIAGHGHGGKSQDGQFKSGIHGIAPTARILSIRVTLSPGDPDWSNSAITARLPGAIAAGIRYAVDHNARIIDLPEDPGQPGISGWGDVSAIAGGSPAERSAVDYAISRGVLLVAPAGDNARAGDAVSYPAAYPSVMSVGAFDKSFSKAPFSSHQDYVTLTAAGVSLPAAAPSGYQSMSSTWAASAIVAGVAALIRAQFPSLTSAQVSGSMTSTTRYRRPDGRLDGSGYGAVDALGAIDKAATISPPHAMPATDGSLPRQRPSAPHVVSQKSLITKDLIADGEISAAAFAALLLLIMLYSIAARGRDRRDALVAAERERQEMARAANDSMPADPLLEFFGPQHPPAERPAAQRPAASIRYQPRPSLSGRSTLTARSGQSGSGSLSAEAIGYDDAAQFDAGADFAAPSTSPPGALPSRVPQASVPPPSAMQSSAGSLAAAGLDPAAAPDVGFRWAARRAEPPADRPARVSGTPPWEPAPQPTSALPWAVLPAPSGGTTPRAAHSTPIAQAPPPSLWEDKPASTAAAPSSWASAPEPTSTSSWASPREPSSTSSWASPPAPSSAAPWADEPAAAPWADEPARSSWADEPSGSSWPDDSEPELGTAPGLAGARTLPSQPPAEIWGHSSEPASAWPPAGDFGQAGDAEQGASQSQPGSPRADTGSHPIYVWNPTSATTDSFPTVVDGIPPVTDDRD